VPQAGVGLGQARSHGTAKAKLLNSLAPDVSPLLEMVMMHAMVSLFLPGEARECKCWPLRKALERSRRRNAGLSCIV